MRCTEATLNVMGVEMSQLFASCCIAAVTSPHHLATIGMSHTPAPHYMCLVGSFILTSLSRVSFTQTERYTAFHQPTSFYPHPHTMAYVIKRVRLTVPSNKAKPSPQIGQALGSLGINMMKFCKEFNATTTKYVDVSILSTTHRCIDTDTSSRINTYYSRRLGEQTANSPEGVNSKRIVAESN